MMNILRALALYAVCLAMCVGLPVLAIVLAVKFVVWVGNYVATQ